MAAYSKLWYLERFHFTDALTDAQKREVREMARMFEVKRGQRIYVPGDPSDQVFLLKVGVVRISTPAAGEDERILAFLYPGDIFGELAVVDEAPRAHLATVHEDAVLCSFPRDVLLRVIPQAPALGYRITKLIGVRLRRFETRVEELLFKSAHARVAHALLDMATDYGIKDNGGVLIPIRLNQKDLGNLVGLARETVNAVLQDFKERGLIDATRRSIRITDPSRLRLVS
ncbi:MAG: Crp/Fnr family transcriptional regulator [Acidobacteria bacterium]|nr:Crp/Fnr family transcriptional regulator [Acidobacteriota bacterium]